MFASWAFVPRRVIYSQMYLGKDEEVPLDAVDRHTTRDETGHWSRCSSSSCPRSRSSCSRLDKGDLSEEVYDAVGLVDVDPEEVEEILPGNLLAFCVHRWLRLLEPEL